MPLEPCARPVALSPGPTPHPAPWPCSVLAVTIGNVHGKYARQPPQLDWARLDAVRAEAGETPLVLHGASGLPDDMLRRAIRAGICKFNVNTEVRAAAVRGVAEASAAGGDVLDLMRAGADAMVPIVEAKLRAFRRDRKKRCSGTVERNLEGRPSRP